VDSGLVTGFIHLDDNHDRLKSLERVSLTALVVHLNQLYQNFNFFNRFHLGLAVP
jgi:hypothetical protein